MAAILGCSITTQCPQGGIGSQFNVPVKPGSQTHVCETLKPDVDISLEVRDPLASLNIQSDYPAQVTLHFKAEETEPVVVQLDGTNKGGRPYFFLEGFAGSCDLDNLGSIVVKNVATKYNDSGTALGKMATVRVLFAAKP